MFEEKPVASEPKVLVEDPPKDYTANPSAQGKLRSKFSRKFDMARAAYTQEAEPVIEEPERENEGKAWFVPHLKELNVNKSRSGLEDSKESHNPSVTSDLERGDMRPPQSKVSEPKQSKSSSSRGGGLHALRGIGNSDSEEDGYEQDFSEPQKDIAKEEPTIQVTSDREIVSEPKENESEYNEDEYDPISPPEEKESQSEKYSSVQNLQPSDQPPKSSLKPSEQEYNDDQYE